MDAIASPNSSSVYISLKGLAPFLPEIARASNQLPKADSVSQNNRNLKSSQASTLGFQITCLNSDLSFIHFFPDIPYFLTVYCRGGRRHHITSLLPPAQFSSHPSLTMALGRPLYIHIHSCASCDSLIQKPEEPPTGFGEKKVHLSVWFLILSGGRAQPISDVTSHDSFAFGGKEPHAFI